MQINRRKLLAGATTMSLAAALPNISFADAKGKKWDGKSLIFDVGFVMFLYAPLRSLL